MKWRRLFGIVLACGMLAGCSATPSNQPQSDTATDGDYTLTIASSQSAYKASELKPGQLLDVTVTYTYTGDQSDITVQHSDPLCLVDIADASGQSLLNRCFFGVFFRDSGKPFVYIQGTVRRKLPPCIFLPAKFADAA